MLNYKMNTFMIETDAGFDYVTEFEAIKGVLGTGETPQESIEDLFINAKVYIEYALENGITIPPEDGFADSLDNYSGKIAYRPGKQLHMDLSQRAKKVQLSINSLINEAVNVYFGKKDAHDKVFKEIEEIKNTITSNHKEVISKTLNQNRNSWVTKGNTNVAESFAA